MLKKIRRLKHLIVSGPSGAGKGYLIQHLLHIYSDELSVCISSTTRQKREEEEHGKHYFFVSPEEFAASIKNGEILEYNNHFGKWYGTRYSEVIRISNLELACLFEVDVDGALKIMNHELLKDDVYSVFLSITQKTQDERLAIRNSETVEQKRIRKERLPYELSMASKFTRVVPYDNFPKEKVPLLATEIFNNLLKKEALV